MPCFHPWIGYRAKEVNRSGKRSIVSNPRDAYEPDNPLKMPCGQCMGCRMRYAAHWAVRCSHEASLYESSCFVTLTYRPECMPWDQGIHVKECQDFMKRLRDKVGYGKVRVAYCGEYGDKYGRPHYHFLLFNLDFNDRYPWRRKDGMQYYRSPALERLWPYGNSELTDLNYYTCCYVSRYMTKKLKGDAKYLSSAYERINYVTGEYVQVNPEFFHTSRKPGIAKAWFQKFWRDVYPHDHVVINGKHMPVPKFYDSQFEILDPWTMDDVKERRILRALDPKVSRDNTRERLLAKEECLLDRVKFLKRSFESEGV